MYYLIIIITLIIYYLFFHFDIDIFMKDILKNYKVKENFSIVFKPNKLYKLQDKIYLLDTNNILVKDKNPLIFKSFDEYKSYILSIEKTVNKELIVDNLENIKHYNLNNNKSNKNIDSYQQKCKEKVVFCNNEEVPLDILDPIESDKCKKNICNINFLDKKSCEKVKDFEKREIFIKEMCDSPKPKKMNKECDSFNKFVKNKELYNEFCINNNNLNMENCMLGEYFKDNLLEFEL